MYTVTRLLCLWSHGIVLHIELCSWCKQINEHPSCQVTASASTLKWPPRLGGFYLTSLPQLPLSKRTYIKSTQNTHNANLATNTARVCADNAESLDVYCYSATIMIIKFQTLKPIHAICMPLKLYFFQKNPFQPVPVENDTGYTREIIGGHMVTRKEEGLESRPSNEVSLLRGLVSVRR